MESNKKITLTDAKGNMLISIESSPVKSQEGIGSKIVGASILALIAAAGIGCPIRDKIQYDKIVKEFGEANVQKLDTIISSLGNEVSTIKKQFANNARKIVDKANASNIGKFELDDDFDAFAKCLSEGVEVADDAPFEYRGRNPSAADVINTFISGIKHNWSRDIEFCRTCFCDYEIKSFDKFCKIIDSDRGEPDWEEPDWASLQKSADNEEDTIAKWFKSAANYHTPHVTGQISIHPNPDDYVGYGNVYYHIVLNQNEREIKTLLDKLSAIIKKVCKK